VKICIWFGVTDLPWGGGNQFLRALSSALEKAGHTVSHIPKDADVVLINSHNAGPNLLLHPGIVAQVRQIGRVTKPWLQFIPAEMWKILPRRGPAIIHRLDGVARLIRGRKTVADRLVPAINRLADFTIFQSYYSLKSFASCGLQPKNSDIIFNGVDNEIFYLPSQTRLSDRVIRLIAASWSPNPRKGFAILAKVSQIPGVEVRFAGRWCETINPLKVELLGEKTSSELAEYMRNSDAMIHAAQNEPCSNAILEALACGLPVLYLDSGGNRELAGEYGVEISDDLQDDVERLRVNLSILREKVRAAHSDFLIGPVAKRYTEVFESALQLRRAW
jgi:glycosyltransferase involved in cell wall biosynthesis